MEQIFEFTALENGETWGFEWGIGTEDEAIAYLDLLNKKIFYSKSPDQIAWKFTVLDYNPREDDDLGEESEIVVLGEEANENQTPP